MANDLPWEDLKYVLALSRHGTAKGAGQALGVNATTVSRRVQALEAQVGVRLFDRRTDGVVATQAGLAAVASAERMEVEALDLDAQLRGQESALRGALRVTALDTLVALWAKDLADFTVAFPQVELTVSTDNFLHDLLKREADIALRLTARPPEQLLGKRVCEVFFAVYVSPELARRRLKPKDPSYDDVPWIGWDEPCSQATDRVVAKYAPGALMSLRVTSMSVLGDAIRHGVGASVMPCYVGDRLEGVQRLGPYFEGGLHLWVLTHPQLRRTVRVKAVRDRVEGWARRDKDLLEGRRPSLETIDVTVPN